MATPARTLKQKAYREMKAFLVIALYLWAFLAILEIHRSVVLRQNYIDAAAQAFAFINALALAKVMLLAKELHLGDHGPRDAALIYPTLLRSAKFALVLAGFKILEDVAVGLYRGRSFNDSISDIGGGTAKGIVSLTAIAFVALIPFFAFTELGRVLGEGKLTQVFFHRRQVQAEALPLQEQKDQIERPAPRA